MKKYLGILAVIILSLAVVSQVYAGYTIKPTIARTIGTGQIRAGNTNVKAINLFSTTAGDYALIYNADISTGAVVIGELMFEVGISANNSSQSIYTGIDGVDFSAGVYIVSSNAVAMTTVVFDY